MSNHSLLVTTDIHSPFRWIVADNTARLALTVTVDDLTKICLVEDDDGSGNAGVYVLTAVTPTWKKIGNPGTAEGLIEAGAGTNSIILNGLGNTAVGNYSISGGYHAQAGDVYGVALGNYANAYGPNAVAIGGYNANAIGDNSVVLGGNSGTANGDRSTVLGGYYNTANGPDSIALGRNALARLRSQLAISSGNFSNGDTQINSIYTLMAQITHSDANWHDLFVDGTSELLTIPANVTVGFIILLTGTTTNGAKSFSYRIEGAIRNAAGTTTLLASTVNVVYEDDTDFAAQVVADDTNDALIIQVSDSTSGSDVVNWSARVITNEVTKT